MKGLIFYRSQLGSERVSLHFRSHGLTGRIQLGFRYNETFEIWNVTVHVLKAPGEEGDGVRGRRTVVTENVQELSAPRARLRADTFL